MDAYQESQTTDQEMELAYDLIAECLPENVKIVITETNGYMIARYLVRVIYTSHRTGRTVSITAKGESLPSHDNNELAHWTSQLLTTPSEINRHFSRIAWLEKRARQDEWLSAGKLSNKRIVSQDMKDEMIPLPYNEEGATYDASIG